MRHRTWGCQFNKLAAVNYNRGITNRPDNLSLPSGGKQIKGQKDELSIMA